MVVTLTLNKINITNVSQTEYRENLRTETRRSSEDSKFISNIPDCFSDFSVGVFFEASPEN